MATKATNEEMEFSRNVVSVLPRIEASRVLALAVLRQAVRDIKLEDPIMLAELEEFIMSPRFDYWWIAAEIGGNCGKARKRLLAKIARQREGKKRR